MKFIKNYKLIFFLFLSLTVIYLIINTTQAADIGFTKIKKMYMGNTISETQQTDNTEGHMKEIAQFYGKMAECDCKEWNDLGICEEYMTYDERKKCRMEYPFWNPGTFKIAGSLAIEGANMILNGIDTDNDGYHWIMTGFYEPVSNAIGFLRNSYDIYFRGNIYIPRDLESSIHGNSIYFDASKEEKIYEDNGNLYFYIKDSEDAIELENSGYQISVNQGLEVSDFLRSEAMIFNDSRLVYCDLSEELGINWDALGCLDLTEQQINTGDCACINDYGYNARNEKGRLTSYKINRKHTENFIYKNP